MKCSLCKQELKKGCGKLFSKKDGTTLYFCSSKCERNFNMGRTSRKLNWIRKKRK